MEEMTAEERALAVKRLAEQLAAEGRKDLLLRAIGVPLLEELRIEAARGELSRLVITEDYRFLLADYHRGWSSRRTTGSCWRTITRRWCCSRYTRRCICCS